MSEQETIERGAEAIGICDYEKWSDAPEHVKDECQVAAERAYAALRPGDVLPNGMVVRAPLRALEWIETFRDRGDGYTELSGCEAQSFGDFWYSIRQYLGTDGYGWSVHFDCETIADHDDLETAKAAAQADFQRRVDGCFHPLPSPPKGGA